MQVSPDVVFAEIGRLYVEKRMLEAENEQLKLKLNPPPAENPLEHG
jgi:hypothetical protein